LSSLFAEIGEGLFFVVMVDSEWPQVYLALAAMLVSVSWRSLAVLLYFLPYEQKQKIALYGFYFVLVVEL